jgi:hypothetical protein
LHSEALPPQIQDLMGGGASITWSHATPNANVFKEGSQPAAITYLGYQPREERIKGFADGLVELLRVEGKEHQRRVAVCYKNGIGATIFAEMPALTRIDHAGGSLASIVAVL